MPIKGGAVTAQERGFVDEMVKTRNPVYAAAIAGYKQPERRAYANLAKPAIQAEIRARELARLHNDLLPASMNVLAAALNMETAGVPWGSRITAAKIVQDRVFSPGESAGRKDLADMSADEIKDQLAELQGRLADIAKPIVDAEPNPDSGAFD